MVSAGYKLANTECNKMKGKKKRKVYTEGRQFQPKQETGQLMLLPSVKKGQCIFLKRHKMSLEKKHNLQHCTNV